MGVRICGRLVQCLEGTAVTSDSLTIFGWHFITVFSYMALMAASGEKSCSSYADMWTIAGLI